MIAGRLTGVHALGDGGGVDEVTLAYRARQVRLERAQREIAPVRCHLHQFASLVDASYVSRGAPSRRSVG